MKIIPCLFFLIFRSHKKGILHPILVSFYLFSDLVRKVSCDHYRATYFYIATVKEENRSQCLWEAYPCRSVLDFKNGNCRKCNGECPTMGYRADETKQTGSFYLKQTAKLHFAVRKSWVKIDSFLLAICIYNVKFGLKYSREYCYWF